MDMRSPTIVNLPNETNKYNLSFPTWNAPLSNPYEKIF